MRCDQRMINSTRWTAATRLLVLLVLLLVGAALVRVSLMMKTCQRSRSPPGFYQTTDSLEDKIARHDNDDLIITSSRSFLFGIGWNSKDTQNVRTRRATSCCACVRADSTIPTVDMYCRYANGLGTTNWERPATSSSWFLETAPETQRMAHPFCQTQSTKHLGYKNEQQQPTSVLHDGLICFTRTYASFGWTKEDDFLAVV